MNLKILKPKNIICYLIEKSQLEKLMQTKLQDIKSAKTSAYCIGYFLGNISLFLQIAFSPEIATWEWVFICISVGVLVLGVTKYIDSYKKETQVQKIMKDLKKQKPVILRYEKNLIKNKKSKKKPKDT